jgi:CheY-like chemotaxis protein
VRDYIVETLREAGHVVLEADCGEEAVRQVREHEVDLAFVDLMMPDMGGEECARRICAARPGLAERLVFMSGDSCHPPGDLPFLLKPMGPDEILDAAARAWVGAGVAR